MVVVVKYPIKTSHRPGVSLQDFSPFASVQMAGDGAPRSAAEQETNNIEDRIGYSGGVFVGRQLE